MAILKRSITFHLSIYPCYLLIVYLYYILYYTYDIITRLGPAGIFGLQIFSINNLIN